MFTSVAFTPGLNDFYFYFGYIVKSLLLCIKNYLGVRMSYVILKIKKGFTCTYGTLLGELTELSRLVITGRIVGLGGFKLVLTLVYCMIFRLNLFGFFSL